MPERPGTPLKRCALKNKSGFLGNYACTTFVALVLAQNVENTSKSGRKWSFSSRKWSFSSRKRSFSSRKWSLNGPQTVAQRAADALLFAGRFRKSARIDVLMA